MNQEYLRENPLDEHEDHHLSLEQLLQQIWEPINRIYKLEVCAEWKA